MSEASAPVRFENVTRRFGQVVALEDFSLAVAPGEFVTLLGPSGSGKTTALNILAGFDHADAGAVFIGERAVGGLPPEKRNVGMVFQNFALFPHMSVFDNVAFPLRMRGVDKARRARRVTEALAMVRLADYAERRPNALSGGQRQRVALARAVVAEPPVLLMDECLSALDLKLREELQQEIRRLHRVLGTTVVFVTHDQGEALSLSDRVAVMESGRVRQVDTPGALYDRPASRFVADFVGRTNIVEAPAGAPGTFADIDLALDDRRVRAVSLRPEKLRRTPRDGDRRFEARVEDVTFLGAAVESRLVTRSGAVLRLSETRAGTLPPPERGQTVEIGYAPGDAVPLFD
ncbi:ABC transporter ATP-binding protein [Aquibium sp. A9E412]|uniref:ABC transporter ATP-binding protein n=1 Tax=Aquibium sp. A9E412 TaxID=2976767 RepID=UPI0025AF28C8|nr:ABC transporter ATP-binding protein [Aquibium sp. A9E412]MDN2567633.1 ABC transporter ATP-binding protein [Aquibium sp. A9E412]